MHLERKRALNKSKLQRSYAMISFWLKSHKTIWSVKKTGGSPCGSVGKDPPAMQETWVRSLGWEDALEKGKAPHSSILAVTFISKRKVQCVKD